MRRRCALARDRRAGRRPDPRPRRCRRRSHPGLRRTTQATPRPWRGSTARPGRSSSSTRASGRRAIPLCTSYPPRSRRPRRCTRPEPTWSRPWLRATRSRPGCSSPSRLPRPCIPWPLRRRRCHGRRDAAAVDPVEVVRVAATQPLLTGWEALLRGRDRAEHLVRARQPGGCPGQRRCTAPDSPGRSRRTSRSSRRTLVDAVGLRPNP